MTRPCWPCSPTRPSCISGPRTTLVTTTGNTGAAGTVTGAKRLIREEEAERVGLLDGTYQQFYLNEQFQQKLNAGHFDKGLVPGFWR